MKSIFAKIVDSTVGAALVFFAAFAVLRYYAELPTAMFGAACITAAALAVLWFRSGRTSAKCKLTKAADTMFFDFMFLPETAPARALGKALNARGISAVTHGNGLYVANTAAFFAFDAPPDEKAVARMIARAKHFGAKKAVVFCKTQPTAQVDIDGFETRTVVGDDVYTLFASLGACPEHKYDKTKKTRRAVIHAAFGTDKIVRYVVLSVALFFAAWWTHSIVTVVCAALCAAFALASSIIGIVNRAIRNSQAKVGN